MLTLTEELNSLHHGIIIQTVQEKLLSEIDARLIEQESGKDHEKTVD